MTRLTHAAKDVLIAKLRSELEELRPSQVTIHCTSDPDDTLVVKRDENEVNFQALINGHCKVSIYTFDDEMRRLFKFLFPEG